MRGINPLRRGARTALVALGTGSVLASAVLGVAPATAGAVS